MEERREERKERSRQEKETKRRRNTEERKEKGQQETEGDIVSAAVAVATLWSKSVWNKARVPTKMAPPPSRSNSSPGPSMANAAGSSSV